MIDDRPRTKNRVFFRMYGTLLYFVCCVWSTKNQESEFFFSNAIDPETDHSSPIDEFTTDNDARPMEHDGFGGGESIGASGEAILIVQGALLHAFHQHTQDLAYVAKHTQDLAYVPDWR